MAGAASAETLIVASPQVPEGFDGDALKTHTQNVVVQTYENLVVYGKKMVDGQMKNDPQPLSHIWLKAGKYLLMAKHGYLNCVKVLKAHMAMS